MQLLMREHHRLRVAVGGVVFDPIMARAVFDSCRHARLRALAGVNEKALRQLVGKAVGAAFASRPAARRAVHSRRMRKIFEFGEIESSERLQQRRGIVDRPKSQRASRLLQMVAERCQLKTDRVRIRFVEHQKIENRQQFRVALVARPIGHADVADFQ